MSERKRRTCKVKTRKKQEQVFIPTIPCYNVPNNVVDFGNKVRLLSIPDQTEIPITVKKSWEQMDMSPVEKLIIHKKIGDVVSWGEYSYQILSIT